MIHSLLHSDRMKTTLLLGALVVAALTLSRAERTQAEIPPCYPNNCPDLTIGYNNLRPTADGFTVDVYVGAVNGYDVYACLGNSTQCVGSQYADPTMWKDISRGICESSPCNVAYTGLRSNRTYQNVFIEAVNGAQYDNVNIGPVTTWPAPQFTPADTDDGCSITTGCRRTISWTTSFPGDSKLYYGLSSPTWEKDFQPNLAGDTITDVNTLTSGQAWSVTYNGRLLLRSSAGTWTLSGTTFPATHLRSVDFASPTEGWMVGDAGFTSRTTDGGNTWQSVALPGNPVLALFGVSAPISGRAWAVGQYQTIYFFNGGGWTQSYQGVNTENLLTVFALDTQTVIAAGTNGQVLRRVAGAWQAAVMPNANGQPIYSVNSLDGKVFWAGGGGGKLWRSVDSGQSWTSIPSGTTNSIVRVIPLSTGELWLATTNSVGHSQNADAASPTILFDAQATTISPQLSSLSVSRGDEVIVTGTDAVGSYSLCHPSPGFCATPYSELAQVNNHSITLTNLQSNTTYYYAAESFGSGVGAGAFGTFTTVPPDTVPPTISITAPAAPYPVYTRTSPYPVRGAANDDVGLQRVTLTDNGTNQTVTGTTSWSSSVTLQPGLNSLTATAADGYNTATATASLFYDAVAPTVVIQTPANNSTVNVSSISLTGTAADSADQIAAMDVQVNGGARQAIAGAGGSGTINWSASASLTAGLNTVTVFARDRAGNEGTASVNVTYNVPTFTISATPTSRSIFTGQSALYTITVNAVNNFTGTVQYAASGQPSGSTPLFTSTSGTLTSSVTTVSTTLIVPTSSSTSTAGSPYTMTVTANDSVSGITKSTTVTLILTPAPDFTLSATPSSQSVVAGQSTSYQIFVSGNATYAGGDATFSVTGLPSGTAAAFAPTSVPVAGGSSNSTVMTVTTQTSTPTGSATLTLTATDGTITHQMPLTLTVQAAPDFTLDVQPASQSTTAGSSTAVNFNGTVTPQNGFSGQVAIGVNADNNNPNIVVTLNPTTVTLAGGPAQFTANVTVLSPIACPRPGPCTYVLTFTATAGALSHTVPVNLIVAPDTTAPTITNPTTSVSFNEATISWQTNEPANSSLTVYSDAAQTLSLGTMTTQSSYCTAACHSFRFTGLAPLTTYYYSVSSTDQAFEPNTATVSRQADNVTPLQFTTSAAPDNTPPTVSITQPAGGTEVRGAVTVTGVGADNNPMSRINFKITAPGVSTPLLDTQFTCP